MQSNGKYEHYERKGDKVYFGTYPMTRIKGRHARSLRKRVLPLPTPEDANGWTDTGYYIDGERTPFMWYIDVECGDKMYRGVYFERYRPKEGDEDSTNPRNQNQLINGYGKKMVYWFRYDPIEWYVTKEEPDKLHLIATHILDSQPFNETVTQSDYATCAYRQWLNHDFYMTAFHPRERNAIIAQRIDLTEDVAQSDHTNKRSLSVALAMTDDVYPPTRAELNVAPYNSGATKFTVGDDWCLTPTPYAGCQGLSIMHCMPSEEYDDEGNVIYTPPTTPNEWGDTIVRTASYWLRDPNEYNFNAQAINDTYVTSLHVRSNAVGVVPAVCIRR